MEEDKDFFFYLFQINKLDISNISMVMATTLFWNQNTLCTQTALRPSCPNTS